jgi:hypothetical protein
MIKTLRSTAIATLVFTTSMRVSGDPVQSSRIAASMATQCKALSTVNFASILDAPTQVLSAKPVQAKGRTPDFCKLKGYVAATVEIHVTLRR